MNNGLCVLCAFRVLKNPHILSQAVKGHDGNSYFYSGKLKSEWVDGVGEILSGNSCSSKKGVWASFVTP